MNRFVAMDQELVHNKADAVLRSPLEATSFVLTPVITMLMPSRLEMLILGSLCLLVTVVAIAVVITILVVKKR